MISKSEFIELASNRVLVLDGAMGTMIQSFSLTEADFRGESAQSIPIQGVSLSSEQKGNNDILCLTRPDVIKSIHRDYVEAGANIISTCTFNANAISMHDYSAENLCYEINKQGAAIARSVADDKFLNDGKRILVAGSIGPTNKTASMSPDMSDPSARDVTYDDLFNAYTVQINGLLDGGADLLLFETVFDTINLKAGLDAAASLFNEKGIDCPVMVSLTLSSGGRSFSGQTIAAFLTSIAHSENIVSVGLNCSFGPEEMLPHLSELSSLSDKLISAHPNAGLPDEFGKYAETPQRMALTIGRFLENRLVNIIGGCCGTTPEHIRQIAAMAAMALPHTPSAASDKNTLCLSGLERLEIKPENNFVNIGERCNVAGSRKFLRLIKEHSYDEAIAIARKQVNDGALILDINMDDGMLDAPTEMTTFLNLLAAEPEIARVPVMIDSSDKNTVHTALKAIQGKAIVNSISLKEGEEAFIKEAQTIHRMGAAVVVMAFDEEGQATTFERKIAICSRAYTILTEKVGFPASDIIFDPNVLTIATGIEEHNSFGLDFIRAVGWIKENLPGAKVSGGVSNLSFAFRGNNYLREAMHAVFLYHAISAGMDMAIINPATAVTYSDIPADLRTLLEDVILNRRQDAADDLADWAKENNNAAVKTETAPINRNSIPLSDRLENILIHGTDEFLDQDLKEALTTYPSAMSIIEGPLLSGMNRVGELFGEGKMFLPQVVKTARTMNKAVEILRPEFEKEDQNASASKAGNIVIATVKGDVHDIGKNIVSIVLACNNYNVIDLGVMVPAEKIVNTAIEANADIICLSGLITPSLSEMIHVAEELQRRGLRIPVFVGGATTSKLHTAVRIAPVYDGPVIHIADAARNPIVAARLLNPDTRDQFISDLNREYADIREEYENRKENLTPLATARANKFLSEKSAPAPNTPGRTLIQIPVKNVVEFINWKYFFNAWKVAGASITCECGCKHHVDTAKEAEAEALHYDALNLLKRLADDGKDHIKAIVALHEAYSDGDDIVIDNSLRIPTLRQQKAEGEYFTSLADYFAPTSSVTKDYAGIFAVSAGLEMDEIYAEFDAKGDTYAKILLQSVCDRLAEASAEWLHQEVRRKIWGYAPDENLSVKEMWQNHHQGIRPAVGYPSLPDQTLMHLLNTKLNLEEIGVSITENGAMTPTATISGILIANPDARYFSVGKIGDDQIKDYANRRDITPQQLKSILRN